MPLSHTHLSVGSKPNSQKRAATRALLSHLYRKGDGADRFLVEAVKVSVVERIFGDDALARRIRKHLRDQLKTSIVEAVWMGHRFPERLWTPFGEILFIVGQLRDTLPQRFVGRAEQSASAGSRHHSLNA